MGTGCRHRPVGCASGARRGPPHGHCRLRFRRPSPPPEIAVGAAASAARHRPSRSPCARARTRQDARCNEQQTGIQREAPPADRDQPDGVGEKARTRSAVWFRSGCDGFRRLSVMRMAVARLAGGTRAGGARAGDRDDSRRPHVRCGWTCGPGHCDRLPESIDSPLAVSGWRCRVADDVGRSVALRLAAAETRAPAGGPSVQLATARSPRPGSAA